MVRFAAVFLVMMVPVLARAEVVIEGKKSVVVGEFAVLTAKGVTGKVLWDYYPDPPQLLEVGNTVAFIAPKGTKIRVTVTDTDFEKKTQTRTRIDIVFEGEPTPIVPPKPVDPPVPVIEGDLRVLFLYETSATLSSGQANVLISPTVRKYLDDNCFGGNTGYRFWDKDTTITTDAPIWKDLLTAAKADSTPIPKLIVFKGNKGVSFPWPDSADKVVDTVKPYVKGK